MINALSIIPCKTDSCPTMGDYAIKKKMNVKWGSHKIGDIVLFDFNHNGTSDHIGIVIGINGNKITTIEGNTGSGSNTNGGQVQIRSRVKSNVNYFVRPKYTNAITPEMVIATARAEVGVKESPKNSNKVKYNEWFYGKNQSAYWCCTFVCWVFAHVKEAEKPIVKPTGKYGGAIPTPTLKKGSKGENTKNLQRFLNWYHADWKLAVDGIFGGATKSAVEAFQRTEGIAVDGIYGKDSYNKANAYKYVEPPKPEPKPYGGAFPDLVAHSGQKINATAKDLSYAYGTKKATYTYPKGKAKASFTKAINKVYPNRKGWSKQCQAGASCDVGAGTVIRYSGIDTNIPRGLSEQIPHLKKSSLWKNTGLTKTSQMKAGDVGVYIGKKSGAHIWIKVDGYTAEASHTNKYFMRLTKSQPTSSGKKTWGIYRATKASPIKRGDKGTEVAKWQNFLNWAGFPCGNADGVAGEKFESATKAFQKSVGLDPDGIVGSGTIGKAKAVTK